MSKAQVTIEFLFSLLFYLIFLSLLLSSIHHYTLAIQTNFEELNTLMTLEETARILDSYYSFDSHFSLEIEGEHLFKDNLIYDSNSSMTLETLYSEGELNGEAA